MFFKSLKTEILFFTVTLIIVTIIITTLLGVFSTKIAGQGAEKATTDILRLQAKEFLMQITESVAIHQNLLFKKISGDTANLASYIQNLYDNPSVFRSDTYWKFDERVFKKDGRYLNNKSDISTFHFPNFVVLNEEEKRKIELTASLDFIVPSILKGDENAVAVYAIDQKGATRYFPNIILGSIVPYGYDPREDIFYKPATLRENPEKKVVWSGLYNDPAGQGFMITATAPIYTKNGFEGIVGIDVLPTSIIKTITSYSPIEGSYAFLIDKTGSTIAFPDQAYEDILGRTKKEGEARSNLVGSSSPEFSSILRGMMNGEKGFGSIYRGKQELFIAYSPLKETGFSLAIVAQKDIMLKAVAALHSEISNSIQNTITKRILPISVFLLFFTSILGFFLVSQIVKPVRELTFGVQEVQKGNLDYQITLESKNEIGKLATAFNQMGQSLKKSREELKKYNETLEQKVKERTHDLTIANEHLKELDREKSEFVSIASHQLRTPLTAIGGYASMLVEGSYGKLSKKTKEAVNRIYQSSSRLALIIEDFLDITKIEQGRMSYQFVTVDMKKLLKDVGEEMRSRAEEKNLEINFNIDEKESFNATADLGKVRQVISNLIDNAIKYSMAGKIDVVLSKDTARGVVRLSVHDTGIGISPETMGKLFQKFSRAEGVKKIYTEGSGLGLYVAQEMMKAHHGRIFAESEGEGKGSTFSIELLAEE